MRGFRSACAGALVAAMATHAGVGCSRTIVAVDPFPPSTEGGAPDSAGPGLLNDLVGFWRLEDPVGSTTARDWSGWSNDGTLEGLDPSTAWVAGGPEGSALSVQGAGFVNVPTSSSIDSVTNAVTVAAWIYLDGAISDYATAISRQFGSGYGQHYHLSISTAQHAVLIITPMRGSNQTVLSSSVTVPQRTWTHIAGTYDGAEMRVYVNGAAAGSQPLTGGFASETNPVIVSGNGNGSARNVSERVPGRLADVMLYRRALSSDEIARIYAGALLPPKPGNADGGGD